MNTASIFAPILPAPCQERRRNAASSLTTRSKWATGILAASLAAAVGFVLGSLLLRAQR